MSRFTSLFNILRCVTIVGALLLAACAPQAEVQLKGEINEEDLTKAGISSSTPESETETPEVKVTQDEAETPKPGDDQGISKVELVGVVSRISAMAWVINDQTISVEAVTEIEAGIAVGDSVKVEAVIQADGSLLALEVKLAGEDQVAGEVNDGHQGEDKNGADDQGEDINDDQGHDSVGDDSGHSADDRGGSSGGRDDSGSHDSDGGSDDSGGHGGGDDSSGHGGGDD